MNNVCRRSWFLLWFLLGGSLSAQTLTLKGTGEISEGFTWRQGDATGVAPNFLRLRVQANATIMGIGFGIDGFFTTENAPGRQPMSYLQFSHQDFQLQELAKKRLQEKIARLESEFKPGELEKLKSLPKSGFDSLKKFGNATKDSLKTDSLPISDSVLKTKQKDFERLKEEEAKTQAAVEAAVKKTREEKVPIPDSVRKLLESLELTRDSMASLRKVMDKTTLVSSWRDSLAFFDPKKLEKVEELEKLKKLSQDPKALGIKELRKIGVLNKAEAVLAKFKSFQIGTAYPVFTPLTVQGVPVHGFFVEFQPNPKRFYLALTGGLSQVAANDTGIGKPFYERWLGATRFGYGEKNGNHFYLSFLYARDKEAIPHSVVLPLESYVLGFDFKTMFWKEKLAVEGELNSALISKNSRSNPLIGDDLRRLLGSSYRQYPVFQNTALTGKLSLKPDAHTKLSITVRRIGTDYITLGVPFLRSDVMSIEGKIERDFWRKQLTISTFARHENDNLENLKPFTTTLWLTGATLSLKVKKYPFVSVTGIVNTLKNNAQEQILGTGTATVAYTLQAKKTVWATTLTGTWQEIGSLHDSLNFAYKGLTLMELVKINRFSFTSAGSVMKRDQYHGTTLILTADAGVGYLIGKKAQVFGGGTVAIDTLNGKKYGCYLGATIPLAKFLKITVRGERNIYEALRYFTGSYLSYREWLLRSGLIFLF